MTEVMETDEFSTKSDTFLAWLRRNGATISSRIRLADLRSSSAGRGIVAAEDLSQDEELFSIPRSCILTVENSSLPTAAWKEVNDPWLSLILAMVYEYLRGSESPWKAYFDVLPENFDSLMYWTDDDLEHLQGSAVVEKIGKDGADIKFTEQLIPVLGQYANTESRSNAELLALCHRMGSTIMAYAFDLEKAYTSQPKDQEDGWEEDEDEEALLPKGMVPLADMLNADADLNNAKLFYEDDKVVMKTIRAVKSGRELYNDYGPLPRADLLRRYGYITDNYIKYDVVEIASSLIQERAKKQLRMSANELDERWKFGEEQGIVDDGYDIARIDSEDGQFPEELCMLLNLLAISKIEFDKLKKKDKLPKPEMSIDAKRLLRTVLVYRYAMYPPESESMTVDEAGTDGKRRAMAVEVIKGEKWILEQAVDDVSEVAIGMMKRPADTLDEEAAAIRDPGKK